MTNNKQNKLNEETWKSEIIHKGFSSSDGLKEKGAAVKIELVLVMSARALLPDAFHLEHININVF